MKPPFYTFWTQITLSLSEMSQKIFLKKLIFTFFLHFTKFAPIPSQLFGKILNLTILSPMCILLKLDYAKFSVSNLCCSNVNEYKLFKQYTKFNQLTQDIFQICNILLITNMLKHTRNTNGSGTRFYKQIYNE